MNKLRTLLLVLATAFPGAVALAGEVPVFPGAEGWGTNIKAGRGGRVIIVDNLKDSGPGSLRDALHASGPRIIVFRVSGVIRLSKKEKINRYIDLTDKHSNFYVAGQTSPGGITITGNERAITGSYRQNVRNFVFRHLRFRVVAKPRGNIDCVEFNGASNFVLDHCDFSGGTDGTLDITCGKYFTVQYCTITNSFYLGGDHGGSLIAYPPTHHITLHHNLWAHHESRCGGWFHWGNKHPEHNGLIDYRNNICYNGVKYTFVARKGAAPVFVNMVGNTFITGPNSLKVKGSGQPPRVARQVQLPTSTVYEKDNLMFERDEKPLVASQVWKSCARRADRPHEMPKVTTHPAKENYANLFEVVGALPPDPMNKRVFREVRTRTGKVRQHEAPFIEKGPEPPADSDRDGMPDFWEKAMKLNPNDPSDSVKDQDGDGYTNIEEYLNDLALARQKQPYHNPVYPVPKDWPDHAPKSCEQVSK